MVVRDRIQLLSKFDVTCFWIKAFRLVVRKCIFRKPG
eukprot:UN03670